MGTSGVGTVTQQFQSGINQGVHWMTEFLNLAQGQYTFDCICTHWYGGAANTLDQDKSMIDAQIKAMADLASQHNIPAVVIGEMGRVNPDQEVRPLLFYSAVLSIKRVLTTLAPPHSANS